MVVGFMGSENDRHAERLARARQCRNHLWTVRLDSHEDTRIRRLIAYCTAVCDGDAKAGRSLAAEAMWS